MIFHIYKENLTLKLICNKICIVRQFWNNKSFIFLIGSVWSKNKLEAPGWEIEAGVRVTGRGRVGADGMVRQDTLS